MIEERVLVTGGTGFIAQHCILALLRGGYRVRTTVRSLVRETEVRANLREGGIDCGDQLSFVTADLEQDTGWAEAVVGCRYVLHGASPTPTGLHASEDDWVRPAVAGNLRVLRAARDAGVTRVVLTSAFGAICAGRGEMQRPFDETDWSDLSASNVWLYQKSKTLSERAAWDFIVREGNGLELSAVNPTAVLGPVLGPDYSHSVRSITNMLDGQSGCPKINCGFVDVRDVADLHVLAMTHPAAKGERFLAIAGESLWMIDVAKVLRRRMGVSARKVPTWELPNWLVRLAALRNPGLKGIATLLGRNMNATSEKAIRLLGWTPRSSEEAIVASAESLIRLGLLRDSQSH
ncbi:dihydroflavonol-4-reductase [Pseudomonas citronellolis]|uniref:SDR family oxidoreductase n=1 Tax=Pseudomonas citronellolis TaxID=53408 RepID=UPI0020A20ED4|nr:aldehyde reductase [Pseudomonas citronellolis]MCP1644907.1 dihydroflavonol-4-reductase [Pseudomonas citronellolis]MCP1667852.1 dihydroflavonol-4-reductase [Pseudomonas citronellolis]MCP1699052.1 dihydroflavonol-4-reductase [Pseudomonas citronellolis]MCP1704959.1 dihydroflavonol-4-reductase [Pseudomonas citronellolis]MCP1799615.1 dihydroflavonol-4-reductase [Pseudomonas citronellolis]